MSVIYQSGEHARLTVDGPLDAEAARTVAALCRRILQEWPRRLDLDLRAVEVYTGDGARAVSDCLLLCRRLEDGVGVTVATDAGRRMLLESMALV